MKLFSPYFLQPEIHYILAGGSITFFGGQPSPFLNGTADKSPRFLPSGWGVIHIFLYREVDLVWRCVTFLKGWLRPSLMRKVDESQYSSNSCQILPPLGVERYFPYFNVCGWYLVEIYCQTEMKQHTKMCTLTIVEIHILVSSFISVFNIFLFPQIHYNWTGIAFGASTTNFERESGRKPSFTPYEVEVIFPMFSYVHTWEV